jgi:hypothetical protein
MQPKPAHPAVPADWKRFWAGDLALGTAFWTYTVFYGLLLNLACTALALIVYLLSENAIVAFLVHLLPLPYMAFAAIGVWRSAERHQDGGPLPFLAKTGAIVLIFASLAI